MSDNWKNMNVNHPKKGLVAIKNLSNNEKGRAIVDLSHKVAELQVREKAYSKALNDMSLTYANHILSIGVLSNKERNEIFK